MSDSLGTDGATPQRGLGALPALALVAGSMLGIGIFISPPQVAEHVSGSPMFLAMWIVGGLAALSGALSLAELGAMLPRSGGDYAYLRRSWGGGIAFAAGWLQLLAIFPGSLASVAVALRGIGEHTEARAVSEAALARDVDLAAAILKTHIDKGLEHTLAAF